MTDYERGFAAGVEAAANAIDPGKWFVYTGPGGRDPEPILLKACERIRALAAPIVHSDACTGRVHDSLGCSCGALAAPPPEKEEP